MKENWKEIYGFYQVPIEVSKLYRLEEELKQDSLSLDIIGFRPIDYFFPSHITPPDLIPFAETGGNGIHFGFLTDFGQNSDLRDAPIVCVTPTNDPPIRYMARNIGEFLDLVNSVPHAEMLESFWSFNEVQIQEALQEFHKYSSSEWEKKRCEVFQRFQKTFMTQPRKIISYLREVKEERQGMITIPTLDGLGVVGKQQIDCKNRSFTFNIQNETEEKKIVRMRDFLKLSHRVEKLAFIRDANYRYVIAPGYDEVVRDLLIELLQLMNLHDEAKRMLARK